MIIVCLEGFVIERTISCNRVQYRWSWAIMHHEWRLVHLDTDQRHGVDLNLQSYHNHTETQTQIHSVSRLGRFWHSPTIHV